MPVDDFANALTINVTSPYAAAVEALAGLEALKEAGTDLTFFYTGNGELLGTILCPSTCSLPSPQR